MVDRVLLKPRLFYSQISKLVDSKELVIFKLLRLNAYWIEKMSRKLIVALGCMFLVSNAANAQLSPNQPTVKSMQGFCELLLQDGELSIFGSIQAGVCSSVISTSVQILKLNCDSKIEGFSPNPSLAVGYVPSIEVAARAFVVYAQRNRQIQNEHWLDAILPALSERFPCNR